MQEEDAQSLAKSTVSGFKSKADHNKTESLFCLLVVVSCQTSGLRWGHPRGRQAAVCVAG